MTKKYNSDDEYSDDPNTVIQFDKYSIYAINNDEDYFDPVIDEINNIWPEFWFDENKSFKLDLEDEIIQGCLVTHQGNIVSETIKNIIE